MKQFEYEILRHPNDEFTQLAYFCSDSGECSIDQVPTDQTQILAHILNERGAEGWQLIQVLFGKDGIVSLWKREKAMERP